MAFFGTFLQYAVIMTVLAAIALLGVFAGRKLRERKDAKDALQSETGRTDGQENESSLK